MDQLRRFKKWQLCFMVCGMQLIINSVHASSTPLCSIPSPRHYVRSLRAYIADLKSAFVESGDYSPETALTEDNFGTVLSGLVNNVGVNGIRVPIIPDYATPASYSDLYRKSMGMPVGMAYSSMRARWGTVQLLTMGGPMNGMRLGSPPTRLLSSPISCLPSTRRALTMFGSETS